MGGGCACAWSACHTSALLRGPLLLARLLPCPFPEGDGVAFCRTQRGLVSVTEQGLKGKDDAAFEKLEEIVSKECNHCKVERDAQTGPPGVPCLGNVHTLTCGGSPLRPQMREMIQSRRLPLIPHVGMFLTDLTYLESLNKAGSHTDRIESTIDEVLYFQQSEYHFPKDGFLQTCVHALPLLAARVLGVMIPVVWWCDCVSSLLTSEGTSAPKGIC